MRTPDLRAYLATGPKTWAQICEYMGCDENKAMIDVKRLEYDGATVDYLHQTIVTLVHDPQQDIIRTCAWPGCRTRLHRENGTGFCGSHLRSAALSRWACMTEGQRRRVFEEVGQGA